MAADTRDQSIPVAVEAVIERMVRLKKEYDDCQRFLDSLGMYRFVSNYFQFK